MKPPPLSLVSRPKAPVDGGFCVAHTLMRVSQVRWLGWCSTDIFTTTLGNEDDEGGYFEDIVGSSPV